MIRQTNHTKWWVLIGTGIMIMLVNLDVTIINLAVATLAKYFHARLGSIQWVVNSYFLAAAITFVIGGKLADLYTKRKIFLIGTSIFGLASLLSGFAPNLPTLIVGRVLQGIGFGMTLSLAIGMIATSFPNDQKGFAIGTAVTITGVSQAAGTALGGIILSIASWRWLFLFNFPLTVICFILTLWAYRYSEAVNDKERLDWLGAVVLAICIFSLCYGFQLLPHLGPSSLEVLLLFTLFIISGGIFLLLEYKTRYPLIDLALLKIRDFCLITLARMAMMFTWASLFLAIPLYLQNILGETPFVAGFIMLLMTIMIAVLSPLAGKWIDSIGYRIPSILAMGVGVLSTLFSWCYLTFGWPIILFYFGLLLYGVTVGIFLPSSINGVQLTVPTHQASLGLGLFFTVAFIGLAIGVSLTSLLIVSIGMHTLTGHLPHLASLSNSVRIQLIHIATGTLSQTKPVKDAHIAGQSFITAMKYVLAMNIFVLVIGTISSIFLHKIRPKTRGKLR